MSNGNTGIPVAPGFDFAAMIAAMNAGVQAQARVPELEAHVRDLQAKLDAAQAHNQGLEQNGAAYRVQIANLNDKVRSLVVERDDVSFREMETRDHLDRMLKVVRGIEQSLGDHADSLDPEHSITGRKLAAERERTEIVVRQKVKDEQAQAEADRKAAEAEAEARAVKAIEALQTHDAPEGQSEPSPTPAPSTDGMSQPAGMTTAEPLAAISPQPGESAKHPTAPSSPDTSQSAPIGTADTSQDASGQREADPTAKPQSADTPPTAPSTDAGTEPPAPTEPWWMNR